MNLALTNLHTEHDTGGPKKGGHIVKMLENVPFWDDPASVNNHIVKVFL